MSNDGTSTGDTDRCRDCGRDLGSGYLCDDCDRVEEVDANDD